MPAGRRCKALRNASGTARAVSCKALSRIRPRAPPRQPVGRRDRGGRGCRNHRAPVRTLRGAAGDGMPNADHGANPLAGGAGDRITFTALAGQIAPEAMLI